MLDRVLEETAQQLDVATAVGLYLVDPTFLPPRERLQPVRAFRNAEILLCEVTEWQPEADALANRVEHVECG